MFTHKITSLKSENEQLSKTLESYRRELRRRMVAGAVLEREYAELKNRNEVLETVFKLIQHKL